MSLNRVLSKAKSRLKKCIDPSGEYFEVFKPVLIPVSFGYRVVCIRIISGAASECLCV